MISKELLELILGFKVVNVIEHLDNKFDSCLEIEYQKYFFLENEASGGFLLLNIFELAHLAKKWALSKRYEINSRYRHLYKNAISETIDSEGNITPIVANTEQEAIFAACEYILNTIKKQRIKK